MFEGLIQQIEAHPRYGDAVRRAAAAGEELVLNYHTHGDPTSWCVSIAAYERNPLEVINPGGTMRELAHIRGFGQREDQCLPLCGELARELAEHFGVAGSVGIYKNGELFRG